MLFQVRLIHRVRHLHGQRDNVKKLVHFFIEAPRLFTNDVIEVEQHLHVIREMLGNKSVRRIAFAASLGDLIGERFGVSGLPSLDGMILGAYGPSGTSIVAQELVGQRGVAGFDVNPLIIEPSIVESFQQLIIGKYGATGAVVVNRDVGLALLKKHSIIGPKVAGNIKQITYGFGVSKKASRSDIYARLVDALRRLQLRGEVLDTLRFYGLKASP